MVRVAPFFWLTVYISSCENKQSQVLCSLQSLLWAVLVFYGSSAIHIVNILYVSLILVNCVCSHLLPLRICHFSSMMILQTLQEVLMHTLFTYKRLFCYSLLWPPCIADVGIIFLPCGFFFLFSSPNLSGRRLDVYYTSTHGVAFVQI